MEQLRREREAGDENACARNGARRDDPRRDSEPGGEGPGHAQRIAAANPPAIGPGARPLASGRMEARADSKRRPPAQIEETTNKWLASVDGRAARDDPTAAADGERPEIRRRRRCAADEPAIEEARQPIMWLLRAFPSPPSNRATRSAGQAGSGETAAAKATTARPTLEKDSSATDRRWRQLRAADRIESRRAARMATLGRPFALFGRPQVERNQRLDGRRGCRIFHRARLAAGAATAAGCPFHQPCTRRASTKTAPATHGQRRRFVASPMPYLRKSVPSLRPCNLTSADMPIWYVINAPR